jgi:hypothetical protein
MGLESRAQLLEQLQDELKSPVLAYVTGDRPGLGTQIASDQLLLFPRHLAALPEHDELNLVLYTRGGETTAAWPIMSFLREHCKRLRVLVPFYAHSAGTLLALGADEILMTKYATLSPIDPTVGNAFNPQDPTNPANRLPIAVEDVMAFLEFAKDHAQEPNLRDDAFRKLGDAVHPLALGNVQRSINQIKQLAQKMLALHASPKEKGQIRSLVNALTTELYSHQHLVNRREAAAMGLHAVPAPEKIETLLLDYYNELCQDLKLRDNFDPAALYRAAITPATHAGHPGAMSTPGPPQPARPPQQAMPGGPITVPVSVEQGYLETAKTCDAFITEGQISQVASQQPQQIPGLPMQVNIPQVATKFEVLSGGWRKLD